MSKHPVLIIGLVGHDLQHIPMLDDLAVIIEAAMVGLVQEATG